MRSCCTRPASRKDNSQPGVTDSPILQAYELDGTLLWSINLGRNIREGAHYTQFLVYDFDGDGKAEVVCKTADGTTDGAGKVIGDANANWLTPESAGETPGSVTAPRREGTSGAGFILSGPEYLTVFEGTTGKALATTAYLPRRHPDTDSPTPGQMKEIWGDGHGNRIDRFLAGVAYLDGERPSIVMARGYYTRAVACRVGLSCGRQESGEAQVALGLRQRFVRRATRPTAARATTTSRWPTSMATAAMKSSTARRSSTTTARVCIPPAGATAMRCTSAISIPANPGLEIFDIQERFGDQGMSLRDARTGKALFTIPSVKAADSGGDKGEGPGRGVAFNIDPRFPGAESWAAGAGMSGLYDAHGQEVLRRPPGRPVHQFRDLVGRRPARASCSTRTRSASGTGTMQTVEPLLVAHAAARRTTARRRRRRCPRTCWGDWREEVIWRTRDNQELRIYTTTIPTPHRMVTLMHDPQYRLAIAWQNVAYNQPPHPSFYLDEAAPLPARPAIRYYPLKPQRPDPDSPALTP